MNLYKFVNLGQNDVKILEFSPNQIHKYSLYDTFLMDLRLRDTLQDQYCQKS